MSKSKPTELEKTQAELGEHKAKLAHVTEMHEFSATEIELRNQRIAQLNEKVAMLNASLAEKAAELEETKVSASQHRQDALNAKREAQALEAKVAELSKAKE